MPGKKDYKSVDRLILGEVYSRGELWKTMTFLCEGCGHRFIETEGQRKARSFIRRKMKAYGLSEVHLESLDYLGWERSPKGAELAVTAPVRRPCRAISLPYCPATPRRGIEADVIDVGDGTPEEFEHLGRRIHGKIALMTNQSPAFLSRWVHRAEKFGRAVGAGAVAFIYVNDIEAHGPETGSLRFNHEAEIPGISISKEDYAGLRRLADRGKLRARLVTRDRVKPAKGKNVIGELPGASDDSSFVNIGAHYDGHDISHGASDNASGVAVLLEIARVLALAGKHLKRTVRFIAFDCEEVGLLGAKADARTHGDILDSMRFMLNIDTIRPGVAKGLQFHGWDRMGPYVQRMSSSMNYRIPCGSKVSAHSDFFPYFLEGVPTASLGNPLVPSRGRGFGHTPFDTLEKIDPRDLREAAEVGARMVLRIANDDHWPLKRRPRKKVFEILNRTGLLANLRLEGERLPLGEGFNHS